MAVADAELTFVRRNSPRDSPVTLCWYTLAIGNNFRISGVNMQHDILSVRSQILAFTRSWTQMNFCHPKISWGIQLCDRIDWLAYGKSMGSEICASQALDTRQRRWRKGGGAILFTGNLNIRHLVPHYFGHCHVRQELRTLIWTCYGLSIQHEMTCKPQGFIRIRLQE